MNCEKARQMIDAYLDGELSAEEIRMLEDHAKACCACMEELQAARMVKETLVHMDDELSVPLQAQAAWRSAVKAEARKKQGRTWLRAVYAAAAALVLFVGVGFVFNQPTEQNAAVPMLANARLIEADGGEAAAVEYSVFRKIFTQEPTLVESKLEILAQEYNGSFNVEGENLLCVELPREFMDEYLKAAERFGSDFTDEIRDDGAQNAVILIQLAAE